MEVTTVIIRNPPTKENAERAMRLFMDLDKSGVLDKAKPIAETNGDLDKLSFEDMYIAGIFTKSLDTIGKLLGFRQGSDMLQYIRMYGAEEFTKELLP